jgi:hypothetical protein
MPEYEILEESAGEPGCELAYQMARQAREVIGQFPNSTADQRVAIALILALSVIDWAGQEAR